MRVEITAREFEKIFLRERDLTPARSPFRELILDPPPPPRQKKLKKNLREARHTPSFFLDAQYNSARLRLPHFNLCNSHVSKSASAEGAREEGRGRMEPSGEKIYISKPTLQTDFLECTSVLLS